MAAVPPQTLFTDLGGVLLTNGWDRNQRCKAAEHFHLDIEEIDERHQLTADTYELGRVALDAYLGLVIFHQPRPFTKEQFKSFMFDQSQPHPEMIELIRRLKRRHNLRVAAISNEGRELMEHRIATFALASFIDVFVCSCFVHHRKPDVEVFRIALDLTQVPPEQIVYVEDRLMFVDIAASLGLKAIHHINYESTRAALADFGLE